MAFQPDDDQHTADQYHDHAATISTAVRRWRLGEITTYAKRKAIAAENQRYYGGGSRKSPVTGEVITSVPQSADIAAALCDTTGIAHETMSAATRARKKASVLARQALDDGATNEAAALIRAGGVDEFRDIIGTAREPRKIFEGTLL